jgi:chitodextrinase
MKKIRLMCMVGLLFIIQNTYSKNYYFDDVATHGSGTMSSPFNDFTQLQYTFVAGDTLFIMPGTYNISTPIRVRNKGTSKAPIVFKAYDANNRPVITGSTMILRLDADYQVFDGLILDGQFTENQCVTIRECNGITIKNSIVKNVKRDGILLHHCRDCQIIACEIFYCLNGTYASQTDAHGVCAQHQRNLLIKDCNIHQVSGDCIQSDPDYDNEAEGALLWDSVFIENCKLWTAPLPVDCGDYKAGEGPGENAIDTKTYAWADYNVYRPYISIKNVEAYGFDKNGYIHDRAAFNIKHNVRAEIENCILHDNERAYRIRGPYIDAPYTLGGANVIMRNCIGYNNLTNVWFERTIAKAKLYNCTFDKRPGDVYFDYTFGGYDPAGFEMKNCVFVGTSPEKMNSSVVFESNNIVAQTSDFRNYAAHDFYPSADSTIIDKGVNITDLTTDITGYARPTGTYDAGAYEYRGENPGDPDLTAPSTPTNLSATALTYSSVRLNWKKSSDNKAVTGYRIYRGGSQIAAIADTVYTNTGLTASTAYTYYVCAYDAANNISSNSNSASVTTPSIPDVTVPTTPTGLTASAASSTSVELSWTASTDNVGVTGYRIYRGGTQIATTSGTSYTNTELTESTAYNYFVRAYDAAGNTSINSNTANVTTPDVTAPTDPKHLNATVLSSSSAELNWEKSTDNNSVKEYRIYRDDVEIAILSDTSYIDSGLTDSTLYSYYVIAYDAAENESVKSNTAVITTPKKVDNSTAIKQTTSNINAIDGYTFPNPAVSVVKCKLNNTTFGILKQVVVVNIIGATVLSFSNINITSDGIISLNINNLSKGNYYIKLYTENDQKAKVFKFVKN